MHMERDKRAGSFDTFYLHTSQDEDSRTLMKMEIRELPAMLEHLSAAADLRCARITLNIPPCPPLSLVLSRRENESKNFSEWCIDESRTTIHGALGARPSAIDLFHLLHEVGHAWVRHALRHETGGIHPEIAVLKEEQWCWDFAAALLPLIEVKTDRADFWSEAAASLSTYVETIKNHIRDLTPEEIRHLCRIPGNSAPPWIHHDVLAPIDSGTFTVESAW